MGLSRSGWWLEWWFWRSFPTQMTMILYSFVPFTCWTSCTNVKSTCRLWIPAKAKETSSSTPKQLKKKLHKRAQRSVFGTPGKNWKNVVHSVKWHISPWSNMIKKKKKVNLGLNSNNNTVSKWNCTNNPSSPIQIYTEKNVYSDSVLVCQVCHTQLLLY